MIKIIDDNIITQRCSVAYWNCADNYEYYVADE